MLVGVGGMAGSVGRYLLSLIPVKAENGFPVMTMIINIIGAFCIALILAYAQKHGNIPPQYLLMLKVGVFGGFTTFSAFSLEAFELFQSGKAFVALCYIILSVALCLIAVATAQAIIK